MKDLNERLFIAVNFCFSAALLIGFLLCSIRLNKESVAVSQLEAQREALRRENEMLTARYESSISLEEIDSYATERLGMQRCESGQIVIIDAGG